MSEQPVPRKLTAIFYADVVEYSRHTREDEIGTHQRVMSMLDFASDTIRDNGGVVLRYAGHALLAEFRSAVSATSTAVLIQTELFSRNQQPDAGDTVQIRIGLNLGEVIEDRGEIFGDGVNLAARLEGAADPGGVCISSTVYEQVSGKIDTVFSNAGEATFKNIDRPVEIYRWHPDPTWSPVPADEPDHSHEKPSLAVLPFDNLGNDPEQEYFADGITEDVITELSRSSELFVIARHSSAIYKGKNPDIRQVARELGVQYVLEGSIRRSGNRIRLNAQLIDGQNNRHIWAERYDRRLDDVFELQDDLTNTIMNSLVQKIQDNAFDRALRRPTQNMAAYDHCARAMAFILRLNKTDNQRALQEAEKAIELDPLYAKGHMMWAQARIYSYWTGWSEEGALALEEGREAALKAIECDKNDFWGYTALTMAELFSSNHERALNVIDDAIRLNPNSADARAVRAIILNFYGNPEEALEESMLAIRHNPSHPHWYLMGPGRALFMLERYREAVPYLEKLGDAGEDISTWRTLLAATYMALERDAEAREQIGRALELKPDLSVSGVLSLIPIRDPEVVERLSRFMRDAGLPE